MGLFTYLAQREADAKKDLDEIKPNLSGNFLLPIALVAVAGLVVYKASAIFDLAHFIIIASLLALALLVYGGLHGLHLLLNYKIINRRQELLLADGKADDGDVALLAGVDVDGKGGAQAASPAASPVALLAAATRAKGT